MGAVVGQHIPREITEALEADLSPLAARASTSKGRQQPEDQCPLRTVFQRDRDRVIHSKAFRRLKHKTQVFIAPVGDHYRTRLTHTLEVTQVSRTIARALRLNEDLTEAIGMGHDLGHPPFGHAGEAALSDLYHGGYWHNRHSVRVVTILEPLNLSTEVLDGIAKHTGKDDPETLEGQIVKTADRIAYLAHDIDDAIRAGIMTDNDIPADITAVMGNRKSERLNTMVWGMIHGSLQQFETDMPKIAIVPEVQDAMLALRRWMFQNVYVTERQKQQTRNVKRIITELYAYFKDHPDEISATIPADEDVERRVVDYIAGMTDRFAIATYNRLFVPTPYEPDGGLF